MTTPSDHAAIAEAYFRRAFARIPAAAQGGPWELQAVARRGDGWRLTVAARELTFGVDAAPRADDRPCYRRTYHFNLSYDSGDFPEGPDFRRRRLSLDLFFDAFALALKEEAPPRHPSPRGA